jgi:hypothetical protein
MRWPWQKRAALFARTSRLARDDGYLFQERPEVERKPRPPSPLDFTEWRELHGKGVPVERQVLAYVDWCDQWWANHPEALELWRAQLAATSQEDKR